MKVMNIMRTWSWLWLGLGWTLDMDNQDFLYRKV